MGFVDIVEPYESDEEREKKAKRDREMKQGDTDREMLNGTENAAEDKEEGEEEEEGEDEEEKRIQHLLNFLEMQEEQEGTDEDSESEEEEGEGEEEEEEEEEEKEEIQGETKKVRFSETVQVKHMAPVISSPADIYKVVQNSFVDLTFACNHSLFLSFLLFCSRLRKQRRRAARKKNLSNRKSLKELHNSLPAAPRSKRRKLEHSPLHQLLRTSLWRKK
jgi:hypothetical protein